MTEGAAAGEAHFTRVVRRHEAPADVPEVVLPSGDPVHLPALLVASFGVASTSEARRLIGQGAVKIDGDAAPGARRAARSARRCARAGRQAAFRPILSLTEPPSPLYFSGRPKGCGVCKVPVTRPRSLQARHRFATIRNLGGLWRESQRSFLRRQHVAALVFENSTANVLRCREPRSRAGFGLPG